MAKFFISADMEGLCGVASPLQCYPKTDLTGYQAAIRQMGREVGAVVDTILAFSPGAEIVVNDAHNTMVNLGLEDLSPKVRLLSGKPKLCAMMSGLDNTFDAAFFVGYHARAGVEKGVLNHTFHSKLFDVKVNGQSYGEGGINALYASLVHRVPVILGAGDAAFCEEICPTVPHIRMVETKIGLTTTAALSHPLEKVLECYRKETQAALESLSGRKPNDTNLLLTLDPPYTLEVTFINTLACDVPMTSPLYERIDGRTLRMTTERFEDLYRGLQSAYSMLAYTAYME